MLHLRTVLAFTLLAGFLSFVIIAPAAFAATQSTGSQYATYSVSTTTPNGTTMSATVNETITPSSTAGFSTLSLQLISAMQNFSYSKLTNSSYAMFPYVPSVGNQSFNFNTHNYSISVSVSQTGKGSASFGGVSYTTNNYGFSVTASKAGGSPMSATGQFSTFPSGLLYSAQIMANGTIPLSVHLVATNLSLNAAPSSSTSSNTTGMAIAGGVGSLAVGVGAFAFYKREKKGGATSGSKEEEQKPLYHVD